MYPIPNISASAEIIDSHAHYNDKRFEGIIDELLLKQRELGVKKIINCGCDFESIDACLRLGEKYDFCYTAVGFHPESLPEGALDTERLAALANSDKVCAIGEIGLDYYWRQDNKEAQKNAFCDQLRLADDLGLPVIMHDREAHGDSLDIIREYRPKGVLHCFSGSREMAEEVVKLGLYIGIGGVLTFKNAKKLIEVATTVPIEKILLETDAPYLAPEPFRGKLNHSALIIYVANALAEIRGMTVEEVINITTENSEKLFNLRKI